MEKNFCNNHINKNISHMHGWCLPNNLYIFLPYELVFFFYIWRGTREGCFVYLLLAKIEIFARKKKVEEIFSDFCFNLKRRLSNSCYHFYTSFTRSRFACCCRIQYFSCQPYNWYFLHTHMCCFTWNLMRLKIIGHRRLFFYY